MAQKKIKNIVWSVNASIEFEKIMLFLSENAPEALDIVGNALLDTIENLAAGYNHNPLDRLKNNNDGTFRAVIIFSYRISYQVGLSEVYILRIRHTSREPLNY